MPQKLYSIEKKIEREREWEEKVLENKNLLEEIFFRRN
jgi:hypothetical protein